MSVPTPTKASKTPPDCYVVIGNPIAHSKSPTIHARFATETAQDIDYQHLLAPLGGFEVAVQTFIKQGGKGANVTVPFKLLAYALATSLTARAQAAGAVNTLAFNNGEILGDNTDGVGLVADIVSNANVTIAGKRILLLGAGGAARGALLPLLQAKPFQLVLANRTVSKAQELAQQFAQKFPDEQHIVACGFEDIHDQFDLIINATSASLQAEVPPIAHTAFGAQTFAYDMMYGQQSTVFMQFASAHGASVRDGLGMLVEQAAESFFLWRAVRPQTSGVYAALRAQLST
ncbi:shikimate dehydrogenase [Glaciimonas immobilis]|uniref:Shikimate dehydrogenase (NADP(+)) n=1 Tax=Glaciimonas immobilis TaxID=728004 RepID=A0A840RR38_9BURK|nr:shikimate dehydrogenase [Glaciimonas immobilis]KAF3997427.1 shikimate dehydrogenase [Glaciimonas immobilis]MBB5200907.1 shikimate dehydrogenase [Glaciimonas immobilis]